MNDTQEVKCYVMVVLDVQVIIIMYTTVTYCLYCIFVPLFIYI